MKIFTSLTILAAGFALSSCSTVQSVGNAAGDAARSTGSAVGSAGSAVGSAAQGTLDASKQAGSVVKNGVTTASNIVTN